MISQELLEKLSKHKDPDVRDLVAQCNKLIEKDFYNTYLSLRVQRTNWDKQYREKEINLFKADDKPIFEMAYKYYADLKPLIELEEFLRSKLTPEQKESSKEAVGALERALQRNGVIDGE